MSDVCGCNTGVKNFGQQGCIGTLEIAQKLILMRRVANDGTMNKILSTDTLNDTFFTGKRDQVDKSKRWYWTTNINNESNLRADNNTFEVEGFNLNVFKGVRTISFIVLDGASPQLADAFESWGCEDSAFYTVSLSDQIGGNGRNAGELLPFRIKQKTMRVKYMPPSKEPIQPAHVMVAFDLHELEKDGDIAYIDYGTDAGDVLVQVSDYSGLVDVVMNAATSITTTGFVVDIDKIYGAQFNKDPFRGGVAADFTLNEVSPTPGAIVITSVTEGTTEATYGKYTFVIPAQTSGDLLRLSFSKAGFEAASTIDIEIP